VYPVLSFVEPMAPCPRQRQSGDPRPPPAIVSPPLFFSELLQAVVLHLLFPLTKLFGVGSFFLSPFFFNSQKADGAAPFKRRIPHPPYPSPFGLRENEATQSAPQPWSFDFWPGGLASSQADYLTPSSWHSRARMISSWTWLSSGCYGFSPLSAFPPSKAKN